MSETSELYERVAKMQHDIEDLKEGQEDIFFNQRDLYKTRIKLCLEKNKNNVTLYLAIDGVRSISKIESDLNQSGKRIAHKPLWAASLQLFKDGLILKIGQKRGSPIYAKKKWAKTLQIDDYVKSEFKIE
jgi:hypothetical protein